MTKNELTSAVSKETGIDKKTCNAIINSITAQISQSLVAGDAISLRKFGTFTLKVRKATTARDIHRGIQIELPEHCIVLFKPAQELAEQVNDEYVKRQAL